MSVAFMPMTTQAQVLELLDSVADPEIPTLSINDLGIIRDVEVHGTGQDIHVVITITPTYSGCPATLAIEADIRDVIRRAGIQNVSVKNRLQPAWTPDWITDRGRQRLLEAGISPPACCASHPLPDDTDVVCPYCQSHNTQVLSRFGSAPCKALWRCSDCLEPFDYFKPH